MALKTKMRFEVEAEQTGASGVSQLESHSVIQHMIQLLDGTAAGQANKIHSAALNIAASGNLDVDLAGVLTDVFGGSLTFARLKAIIVRAVAGNVNNIVVGNAAANPFIGPFGLGTHTVQVRPNGLLVLMCQDAVGWPVVAATGDLLRLANSGAGSAVLGDLVLVGSSV